MVLNIGRVITAGNGMEKRSGKRLNFLKNEVYKINESGKLLNISQKYLNIRQKTEEICAPLKTEDYVIQPITDVSPPKWHIAHTTWFFEDFILKKFFKNYREFNREYNYHFNSYYESFGRRILRAQRGHMTRPSVEEIYHYRKHVDEHMLAFLDQEKILDKGIIDLVLLGLNHEQQHQELLLMDIKYILGHNPLFPVYLNKKKSPAYEKSESSFYIVEEGLYETGYSGEDFCYDAEKGYHKIYLHSFKIQDRLITNEEYLEFIEAGGYTNFRYWLQEGWEWVNKNNIKAPMYWHKQDNYWFYYSLQGGFKKIDMQAPVCHVSFYEADAFSKWKNKRLATEHEWEAAARKFSLKIKKSYNLLESQNYEPIIKAGKNFQFFGDVWEWTNSAFLPYPFYKKDAGAIGEYNSKFMINQMVLRGGSFATPVSHIRHSYRNFFHPDKRWQFSGIRLAESIE
ncbi:MAG: ergothioneine biosynthesis protein EgtB [Cytophagaceae bacterium]